jgi:hypothetical protein
MWSTPVGKVIADLRDLVRGVRQIVPLTEIGKRTTSPLVTTQYFLQWTGTGIPIASAGLYRGRIALIVGDDPEETYTFFAVSYPNPDVGRPGPGLRVIGPEQLAFLNRDSGDRALAGLTDGA